MPASVVRPPLALALARPARTVPSGDWAYEPKFDGWRAAVFSAAGVLQSRAGKNLAHRFPAVVVAARQLGDLVLDGELIAVQHGPAGLPGISGWSI